MKMFSYYRCPTCFKRWQEEKNDCMVDNITISMKCEYCSEPNRSSLDTLKRMVEVMPSAVGCDLPAFMNHLMKHVVLKE